MREDHPLRDAPTVGVADHGGRSDADRVEPPEDHRRVPVERVRRVRAVGQAVPGQVEEQHAKVLGQSRGDELPRPVRVAQAMKEDEGRTGAQLRPRERRAEDERATRSSKHRAAPCRPQRPSSSARARRAAGGREAVRPFWSSLEPCDSKDVDPVLHGRDAPLAALRAGLVGAIAGRGQLALVSGEAGIGKSAIARVIAREAEALGVLVTWGHAWEFADAPPYFPVWPCLRALGIDVGKDALHKHDEGHAFHLLENVVASLARASSAAPFCGSSRTSTPPSRSSVITTRITTRHAKVRPIFEEETCGKRPSCHGLELRGRVARVAPGDSPRRETS